LHYGEREVSYAPFDLRALAGAFWHMPGLCQGYARLMPLAQGYARLMPGLCHAHTLSYARDKAH
jgi:hypothetical protein